MGGGGEILRVVINIPNPRCPHSQSGDPWMRQQVLEKTFQLSLFVVTCVSVCMYVCVRAWVHTWVFLPWGGGGGGGCMEKMICTCSKWTNLQLFLYNWRVYFQNQINPLLVLLRKTDFFDGIYTHVDGKTKFRFKKMCICVSNLDLNFTLLCY